MLVNVLKIVEERVRYFNNGGPFIGFRVSPAGKKMQKKLSLSLQSLSKRKQRLRAKLKIPRGMSFKDVVNAI